MVGVFRPLSYQLKVCFISLFFFKFGLLGCFEFCVLSYTPPKIKQG